MRAPALEPEDRRQQLVAAARVVFAQKGYHAASVSDIVKEAGVARGTFYNYFEGKRDAFQAVLDGVIDQVNRGVIPIDLTHPVPPQVEANLVNLISVMDEDVCRLLFAEAPGIDTEGDNALRGFYNFAISRITRALRTGQAIGLVRDGRVEMLAVCLLGMVKEPVFQAWLAGTRVDVPAMVEEMIQLLGAGVVRLGTG